MTRLSVEMDGLGVGVRQIAAGVVVLLVSIGLLAGVLGLAGAEERMASPGGTPVALATVVSPPPLSTAAPVSPPSATPLVVAVVSPGPTSSPTPLPPTPTVASLLFPSCPPPPGWKSYWVQPGDTLYSLAWRAGTTVLALAEGNCLEGEVIYPGRVIYLPSAFFATPTPVPCGPPPGWVLYTVQRGDTLWNLSYRLGVPIETIRRANCMTGYLLRLGQPLYLPMLPPPLTPTPTAPPSVTPSSTPTPTPSPTVGGTPTSTATPTVTVTPTWTPTPTATPSTTVTLSPTASPTPTSTFTPTPTPTPTASPMPTPTPTFTPTPVSSPTSTPTPTPTLTPTP
ncbi:MAG TPA: LysM domain-containing protein [Anaerolineales bacterium]|nr:LysM domain-containing protein [Anaerolineales bacterium]